MASEIPSELKVWIQFEGHQKTQITVSKNDNIDDLKKEALKNSKYDGSIYSEDVEVFAGDTELNPGSLVTSEMKTIWGTVDNPFIPHIKTAMPSKRPRLGAMPSKRPRLGDMPKEEAFEACQEYKYQVDDLVQDLRLKEHQHRTFAAVLPNQHLLNHSSFTRQNLSARSQSSKGSYSDTCTSHYYLTFPACPVQSSDDLCYTLEDWFKNQLKEDCLDFIKAVSVGLKKNAINALCMFGLQHIITEADMNCWTYETEFHLCKKLPTVLVSKEFRFYNCIGVSEEKEFISVKDIKSNAPRGCSTCSNILQNYQSDVGFYKMTGGPHSIPVLPYEILSSVGSLDASFGATLQKCALGCYETFRIARNFDNTVKEWSGFVLPSNLPCPVVKVTVKPDGLYGVAYMADYQVLGLDKVREEMKSSFKLQKVIMDKGHHLLQQHSSLSPFSYVLRLSEEEVAECGKYFCSTIFHPIPDEFKCYQITSAFAYVFCLIANNKVFYLKCLVSPAHSKSLDNVETTVLDIIKITDTPTTTSAPFCLSEKENQILLMDKYKFHCFKALPPPLDVYEAKKCLQQFVQAVSKSLTVLHKKYLHAHTDVRLENICFQCSHNNQPPIAIFIDLDRCCWGSHIVSDEWFTETKASTALYKRGFTNAQIDWRQLGCTVYWILKATSWTAQDVKSIHDLKVDCVETLNDDLISCDLDTDSISFVIKLIDEGVCECDHFDHLFSQFTTPIKDVRKYF